MYTVSSIASLLTLITESKNDEKFPYLHKKAKRKSLVSNENLGLNLYIYQCNAKNRDSSAGQVSALVNKLDLSSFSHQKIIFCSCVTSFSSIPYCRINGIAHLIKKQ